MDSLKSYLCHSIEFVLNRLNDRFHESDGIRYLVTHIDRILCILSRASSLFNIPPQLECSLQRAHQMLVTLSVACEASVSVLFRSKGHAKNGASKRGGGGEERKETLADKPQDFENHPHRLSCLSGRTDI